MMLTTRGRYAVMAMVDLAGQEHKKPVTLSDIATRQDIALNYLEQIFARLRKNGLVTSTRGPGGGYSLANTPNDIRVADIILAVDEPIAITRCKTSSGCMSDKAKCLTHDLWEGLGNQIYSYLNAVTLADIRSKNLKTMPVMEVNYASA